MQNTYEYNGNTIATVTTQDLPFEDIDDTTTTVETAITVENITSALNVSAATARKWLREGRLTTLEDLEDRLARGYDFHRNYSGARLVAALRG